MKTLMTVAIVLVVAAVAFAATRSTHDPVPAAWDQHALVQPENLPVADFADLTFVFPVMDEATKLPVGSSVARR